MNSSEEYIGEYSGKIEQRKQEKQSLSRDQCLEQYNHHLNNKIL